KVHSASSGKRRRDSPKSGKRSSVPPPASKNSATSVRQGSALPRRSLCTMLRLWCSNSGAQTLVLKLWCSTLVRDLGRRLIELVARGIVEALVVDEDRRHF